MINEGVDESVESAVIASLYVRVYRGIRVKLADLLLETRFVGTKKRGLRGFQILVKTNEFGHEAIDFAESVDIAEFLSLRRVLLVIA